MESLTYVYASYLVGFILLSSFAIKLVLQRRQLRQLLSALESYEIKK